LYGRAQARVRFRVWPGILYRDYDIFTYPGKLNGHFGPTLKFSFFSEFKCSSHFLVLAYFSGFLIGSQH
jgi:hypothetical protein